MQGVGGGANGTITFEELPGQISSLPLGEARYAVCVTPPAGDTVCVARGQLHVVGV